jgi:aquaporin Z
MRTSLAAVTALTGSLLLPFLMLGSAQALGPVVGALIGVIFEWILKGPPTAMGTITAQGTLNNHEEDGSGSRPA